MDATDNSTCFLWYELFKLYKLILISDEPPSKEKKKQKDDIDKMDDPEIDEDQVNPYHNELEEPPEPDNMEIGELIIGFQKQIVQCSLIQNLLIFH